MVVGGTEQPDNVSIWNTDTGITITKQDIIMLLQHLFQKRSTCIFHHLLLLLLSISLTLTPSISLHTQKKKFIYPPHYSTHFILLSLRVTCVCVQFCTYFSFEQVSKIKKCGTSVLINYHHHHHHQFYSRDQFREKLVHIPIYLLFPHRK